MLGESFVPREESCIQIRLCGAQRVIEHRSNIKLYSCLYAPSVPSEAASVFVTLFSLSYALSAPVCYCETELPHHPHAVHITRPSSGNLTIADVFHSLVSCIVQITLQECGMHRTRPASTSDNGSENLIHCADRGLRGVMSDASAQPPPFMLNLRPEVPATQQPQPQTQTPSLSLSVYWQHLLGKRIDLLASVALVRPNVIGAKITRCTPC